MALETIISHTGRRLTGLTWPLGLLRGAGGGSPTSHRAARVPVMPECSLLAVHFAGAGAPLA